MKSRISKDDVELLSRGKSTKAKFGSRQIPHRLTVKERAIFETGKKTGFLKISANRPRENLFNIFKLWCEATGEKFVLKETGENKK